jgi:hypothetical protein
MLGKDRRAMGMLRPARKIGRPFFGARAAVPKRPYESAATHVRIASRSVSRHRHDVRYTIAPLAAPTLPE